MYAPRVIELEHKAMATKKYTKAFEEKTRRVERIIIGLEKGTKEEVEKLLDEMEALIK